MLAENPVNGSTLSADGLIAAVPNEDRFILTDNLLVDAVAENRELYVTANIISGLRIVIGQEGRLAYLALLTREC